MANNNNQIQAKELAQDEMVCLILETKALQEAIDRCATCAEGGMFSLYVQNKLRKFQTTEGEFYKTRCVLVSTSATAQAMVSVYATVRTFRGGAVATEGVEKTLEVVQAPSSSDSKKAAKVKKARVKKNKKAAAAATRTTAAATRMHRLCTCQKLVCVPSSGLLFVSIPAPPFYICSSVNRVTITIRKTKSRSLSYRVSSVHFQFDNFIINLSVGGNSYIFVNCSSCRNGSGCTQLELRQ